MRQVADEAALPAALAALRVTPAVSPATPVELLSVRRAGSKPDTKQDTKGDTYWLYNAGEQPIDQTLTLRGTGAPVIVDTWRGQEHPVAVYRRSAEQNSIALRVQLAPGEGTVVRLQPGAAVPAVTDTDAPQVQWDAQQRLVARATQAGELQARLAGGQTLRGSAAAVPAAQALNGWTLQVQAWAPGDCPTTTRLTDHTLTLDVLKPWNELPGLTSASGVGRYTTQLAWQQAEGRGAELDLGDVSDVVRVRVNGRDLGPVNPLRPRLDLGDALQDGNNLLELELTTPLNNVLREVQPQVFGARPALRQGVFGPVVLRPYQQVVLTPAR